MQSRCSFSSGRTTALDLNPKSPRQTLNTGYGFITNLGRDHQPPQPDLSTTDDEEPISAREYYSMQKSESEDNIKTITKYADNKKRYRRACRQLGVAPLGRLLAQLGQATIQLKSEGLNCKDVNAICSALVDHNNLECLDLKDNKIQTGAIPYISKLLGSGVHITELILADNELCRREGGQPNGVYLLSQLCQSHTFIKKLDMSGNRISDEHAEDVAKIIRECTSLWELSLSHNELSRQGGMLIGDALAKNDNLYSLDLSWNHLRGKGAECVALSLVKNTNLSKLNVSWNGFGFEGCVAMGCALSQNTSLVEVDLSCNRIHTAAVWELWKGVIQNKNLRTLRIGQNPIQPMVTTPLLTQIRDNPQLDLDCLDMKGITVEKEFLGVLDDILNTRPDFIVIFDQSLPVHKRAWDDFLTSGGKPVYNIDPVRLMFYIKKNLRTIDLFNKMDTDGSSTISKSEVHEALKKENFPISKTGVDAIFDYLDKDKNGVIDLMELLHGERQFKRDMITRAKDIQVRDKLDIERGMGDGLLGDIGGVGGRFSQTFRPDLLTAEENLTARPLRGASPLPPIKNNANLTG